MAYLNQRPLSQGEVTFFPVTLDHFDGALIKQLPAIRRHASSPHAAPTQVSSLQET